jgi:hypothetical protein|tara:strand:- start:114 stop:338 length:225 start_codon:yes stop_codon:yes gene_type:complete
MLCNTHEIAFRVDDVHNTKIELYNMTFEQACTRASDMIQSIFPDRKVELQWAKEHDRSEEGERLAINPWKRSNG